MAIFLIMDRSKVNVLDAVKDARGCYKLGDIVEVFDDDTPCVIPPAEPFYLVQITGLTKAAAMKYMEPEMDANGAVVRRRLYHIPINLLPTAVKTKIQTDRYLEITWDKAKTYIENKATLLTEG